MTVKTIVQVWQYEYLNYKGSFWGIGDLIRGVIHLRRYCRIKNYRYVLDIHNHAISKFIKYNDRSYSDQIDKLGSSIPLCLTLKDIESSACQTDLFFCNTNAREYEEVDEEDKKFIREFFVLKDEYEKDYSENYHISGNYSILHLRLGDTCMFTDKICDNYEKIHKIILNNSNSNTVLCTDNQQLKNKKFDGIIIPKTSVCHLGIKPSYDDRVKHTLYDLVLISRSRCIKSYTIYSWTSGFSVWISKCYNIPLESNSI